MPELSSERIQRRKPDNQIVADGTGRVKLLVTPKRRAGCQPVFTRASCSLRAPRQPPLYRLALPSLKARTSRGEGDTETTLTKLDCH